MKTILLLTAVTLLTSTGLLAQGKIAEIEQYEIRSYDPQKSGLVDLVFDVRMEKLTEMLTKAGNFGKLSDVYFKIYWLSPSQYRIEVLGLPKGFQEVREDLTTLIKGKLELVIPEKFSEKFKGYTLKAEPIANGKLVKAIDDTYTMALPEIDMIFDSNGKLKSFEAKAVATSIKTEFFQSPKVWSNNKLVMDKVVSVSKQGGMTTTATNIMEYTVVGGMGFPSKVSIKNVTEGVVPGRGKEKEKKLKTEAGSVLRFSNYEVNTGKAQRFMTDNKN